jgi:prepilin-type N-terminal cleavage/methylation domain-containing protein
MCSRIDFRRRNAGFTLVEVLAAVTIFIIAFLSGTACISQLLVNETMQYQRTMAGTAAMLLADYHVRHALAEGAAPADLIGNTASIGAGLPTPLLTEQFSSEPTPWDNLVFSDGDFAPGDRVFAFVPGPVTDSLSSAALDLSEYQCLLLTVSPSVVEADSHLAFRQVSFWYLPSNVLAAVAPTSGAPAYTTAHPASAVFLGRYLLPDRYQP